MKNDMKYPRIKSSETRKYCHNDKRIKQFPPCIICGEKSVAIVTIENSYFNGDDSIVYACKEHTKSKYFDEIIRKGGK